MKNTLLKIIGIVVIAGLLIWGILKIVVATKTAVPDLEMTTSITSNEGKEALDTWLSKLENEDKFNGGVLLIKEGKPVFMKTYGYTDHTCTKRLTTQSSFRLASVSKQFTAMGIMLLENKGLLGYDTPVTTYITSFPYDGVTVRHLLNMTSGIPDGYLQLAEKHKAELGTELSIQEAVTLLCEYPSKAAPANSWYNYSNSNYILLAGIIENVSGQSFENYMQEAIFDPLDMKNTRVWNLLSATKSFPNKTLGFEKQGDQYIPMYPTFIDGVSGDGGVFASLEDFVIWDAAWYGTGTTLLSQEKIQEAFKAPMLTNNTLSEYGFGWSLQGDVMQHSGGWLAARTYIYRNTASKTCLVILDNSANHWHFTSIQEKLIKTIESL
ncbi:serine hydrolase domain-containing protein [uncultured Dokdonia sp.]|uniref:serine hydrolase domain-containing protein n=1 Tax=uncultured Dokdonia sp. TaxID=575653 RepID=UPI0026249298|nr:serine hydrolase domain-containing protein [uncultured Dokdonia sp.]